MVCDLDSKLFRLAYENWGVGPLYIDKLSDNSILKAEVRLPCMDISNSNLEIYYLIVVSTWLNLKSGC
jgi:hypothetical protein